MKSADQRKLDNRLLGGISHVDSRLLKRLGMAAAMFIILFVLIAVDFSPKIISGLEVNKPSPATVRAPRNITLVDIEKTQEQRRLAAEAVPRIYRFDTEAPAKVRGYVKNFFLNLKQASAKEGLADEQRRQLVAELLPGKLDEDEVVWMLSLSPEDIEKLEKQTLELTTPVMTEKIIAEQLVNKRDELNRRAMAIDDPRAGKLIGMVASENIKANSIIDKEGTNDAIAAAVDNVDEVEVSKLKGETIVTEGEIVKTMQSQFLQELGLADDLARTKIGQITGQAMIAMALLILGMIFLREFQPNVYENNRLLLLVFVILATTSSLAKGLAPLFPFYLIPVAGAAMMTTILVRPRAGIMMAITAGLVTGIIVNSPQYWIYAFMTGLFAVHLTAHISHRSDLTRSGLWLMLASGVMAMTSSMIQGEVGLDVLINAGWGVVGGFTAIIITIGALQFLESAFSITTDMKLLELSNPTQPLLKELMVNAPGTYNHSIITGNLVESVAQKVGSNPLLARTGAYYHDIGKIRRPFFFVENQYGENPHDKTQPNLSYLIITAHVKDGIELAKKHRLPQEIIDIIHQHHGTSLVSYFYNRAQANSKNDSVSENQFRYQGEKPRSREAALIMLADGVEAAARALSKPTHNRLEQMVRKIVKGRLRDGQLDESDLTLADLETITKEYTQTLTTMYHTRIEYPESETMSKKEKEIAIGRMGGKSVGRPDRAAGS